jgi:RNA polymerase sigma factor (sigma-70 family)
MSERIFQELARKTRGFYLSPVKDEPDNLSEEEIHRLRLLALMDQVRKMAIRKYHQMPNSFRIARTTDDWIQDAMIVLFKQCDTYNADIGPFDHYVRFKVSRALIDIQRKLFRANPAVDDDLRKISASWKRENGRNPSAQELADLTGRSVEETEKFLEQGIGQRVFSEESEMTVRKNEKTELSPEEEYIRAETRKILWNCIEQLKPELKLLFIRHELEEMPFSILYDEPHIRAILESNSLRSFQRDYDRLIYQRVRICVSAQYKRK